MRDEITRLEPKFKEILYHCLEEVRATKAALYLSEVPERYELVTEYGFRDSIRKTVDANDDIVDRLITKRAPFFINSLGEDSRFSELLYHSDTSRMLVAPVYSRGKLVGFIDMRDKAAKQAFSGNDVASAQKIVDQLLDVFAQKNLFGQKPPALSGAAIIAEENRTAAETTPVLRVVDEAKAAIGRGVLRPKQQARTLTEAQVNAGAVALPSILMLPGVLIAAFSAYSHLGGVQTIAARGAVSDEAMKSFDAKARAWLRKRGESENIARTNTVYPFGTAGAPIEENRIVTILSAPVQVEGVPALVLTVALEVAPDATTRGRLEQALTQIKQIVEYALADEKLRLTNELVALKLLEPDFQTYPHLASHSRRVADLSERLAHFIGVESAETDRIRLGALVHDVGMRLLDYPRLYRKDPPGVDDLKVLREHPNVGAALVAASPLGSEIANYVLAHHERADGTGYPSRLIGDQIPVGSRVIQICEAFDAMTANDSYQAPVPAASAVSKIRRAAGTQFDNDIALKFCEMMEGRS